MIRRMLQWFIIAVIAVAIYKFFGGNLAEAATTVFGVIVSWLDTLSDWLLSLPVFSSIFGSQ